MRISGRPSPSYSIAVQADSGSGVAAAVAPSGAPASGLTTGASTVELLLLPHAAHTSTHASRFMVHPPYRMLPPHLSAQQALCFRANEVRWHTDPGHRVRAGRRWG